jgi:hypothetical protein
MGAGVSVNVGGVDFTPSPSPKGEGSPQAGRPALSNDEAKARVKRREMVSWRGIPMLHYKTHERTCIRSPISQKQKPLLAERLAKTNILLGWRYKLEISKSKSEQEVDHDR